MAKIKKSGEVSFPSKIQVDGTSDRNTFNFNRSQLHFGGGDNVMKGKKNKVMKNNPKDPRWGRYLIYFAGVATIFATIWGVYVYFNPINNKLAESQINNLADSSVDLRNKLIGSVFDIGWEINQLKTGLDKDNRIEGYLGKHFSVSGTVQDLGRLSDKEVWVIISGTAKYGNNSYVFCLFDKSWESVLKNMLDVDNKNLTFTGEISGYSSGSIKAENCKINDVLN